LIQRSLGWFARRVILSFDTSYNAPDFCGRVASLTRFDIWGTIRVESRNSSSGRRLRAGWVLAGQAGGAERAEFA